MDKYIDEVIARIGDPQNISDVTIGKYVLLTDDGELFVEGMKPPELQMLIYKLSKILYEQGIAAEFAFREKGNHGEVFDKTSEDTARISAAPMSYAGYLDGESVSI